MSDVDDELLALVGGAESSDDEEQSHRQRKRHSSNEDDEDDEPMNISRSGSESRSSSPAKGKGDVAPSLASRGADSKKTPAKKPRRRASFDDSEEEGEASSVPGSPASLQSAPMDESDSDSDGDAAPKKGRTSFANDDDDDDENKYPVDGLFMSLEEKAEIMSMREVDREQILADRAQEKDRIHQNKLLRRLVSNDEQRKKRSASAADLDEGQRKTSRVRTKVGGTKVGETNSAMDTLKNRRAEKNERNRRREEDRERRKGRSPGSDRDDDDGNDSDVEWAKTNRRSRSPEVKESQVVELRHMHTVQIGRTRFGEVCFYPGLENTVRGSFVRVAIGPDPTTRDMVYRMAMVKGLTKGKPYALDRPEGQPIITDLYVIAAHGKAQREWPFAACSDTAFTESEWSRYQKVCHVDNVTIPKKGVLFNKAHDIRKLVTRTWTEAEVTEKIQRQQALNSRYNGVERMKLEYAIKEAKVHGEYERAERLQEELDHLETPRLALLKTTALPSGQGGKSDQTSGGLTQQERLAQLNAENRRRNAEAVRKAQLKERARVRAIERKIERGESVEEDHSRRVRTRAKFVHDVNDSGEKKPSSQAGSGAGTPNSGTPQLGAQKTVLPHMAKLQLQQRATTKNGLPTIHRPIVDDDIIAALDLDIDENILD